MRMQLVKQHKNIVIRNIDASTKIRSKIKHSSLLPNSFRALIVGPSNCGKTNVMISLLESPNGLKFENIYLYSKSLYQPKYEYLKRLISPIKVMGYYTFTDNEKIIPPDEAKTNSIMIFDDVACVVNQN